MDDQAQKDENSGHAVLLLHGLCGSAAEMGSIPRALERLGFVVSSLEIPGYSASAVTPGVTPDWEEWCDTVDTEIARLKTAGIKCEPPSTQSYGVMTQIHLPGGGKLGLYQPRHERP